MGSYSGGKGPVGTCMWYRASGVHTECQVCVWRTESFRRSVIRVLLIVTRVGISHLVRVVWVLCAVSRDLRSAGGGDLCSGCV